MTANGGESANGLSGGVGGNATGGVSNFTGGSGGTITANAANTPGAGGGAAASPNGNGQAGTNDLNGIGVNGAGSGGPGGPGSGGPGENGTAPGGGGGGEGGDGNRGGNGGNGRIIVTWTCPTPTLLSGSDNQSFCIGNAVSPVRFMVGGALDATVTGLPEGVDYIYDNGEVTISGTPTQAGTFNYTISPVGSCEGSSIQGTIRVNAENSAGTITQNTFCRNSALPTDVIQPTTGATGIGTASGLPTGITASFDNNQIIFSGTPITTGVFSYSIPLTGGCGSITAEGTLTINAEVAIYDPNLDGQNSCPGTPFNPISVGERFGLSYQWYSNTNPSNSGGAAISGADDSSYTPPSTTEGTTYYYVEVSGACGSTVISTVSGAFIVEPGNSVSNASTFPEVCINTAIPTITHSTTSATGVANDGVSGANGLPIGVSASWSGNQVTISGTPSESGIFNYNIPLTGGCGTIAATGTITVNAEPIIPSQNTEGQEVCLNTSFTPISVAPLTGLTYQWYSNTTNSTTGGTAISGATSNEFTPPSNTVGDSFYYVIATGPCGSSATSEISGLYKVNPLPVPTFTSQPSGDVCVDDDYTYTASPGQSNYIWSIPGAAGVDYNITSGGSATDNFITVQWLTSGNKSLAVNYTDANGCAGVSPTNSNTVNVRRNSFTPSVPLNPSVCVDTPLSPVTIKQTLPQE